MVDAVTSNRGLTVPARGADAGTWDLPVNGNSALLDTITGGVTAISITGGTTTLNAAQAACGTVSLSGALVTDAAIVFPAVQGWWSIQNLTTGNFVVLAVAGTQGEYIAVPQGGIVDIQVNINTVRFRNLLTIGAYLDLCDATVPTWITSSVPAPFLLCDGSTFSAVTYPYLASKLGGTTLPDARGRAPYYLNGGTGRLTSAGAGIDGSTRFASGGVNGITLAANQIPSLTSSGNNTISVASAHTYPDVNTFVDTVSNGTSTAVLFWRPNVSAGAAVIASSGTNTINVTYTNAGQQVVGNAAPGLVSGIRLIRAG